MPHEVCAYILNHLRPSCGHGPLKKILRRIQWWLEKSATGELHPTDQPVEQLFFASKHELVLPWNFEEIRKSEDHQLVIARGPERPNGGFTCFLVALEKEGQPPKGKVKHLDFDLPPIVQGHIECDPTTLGELSDIFADRGEDILLSEIKKAIRADVSQDGLPHTAEDPPIIILLHIPITRGKGHQPERVFHRAFMIMNGVLKLGESTGALFLQENTEGNETVKKYFNSEGILGAQTATKWKGELVFPMDVLYQNDSSMARRQSGINDEGPTGVLVGAGSLGSALLNLWGRSGWGTWTVIDKDHIKHHNLSRHTAYTLHIGQLKTNVVAQLHYDVMKGASQVTPLYSDACDFSDVSVFKALSSAKVVIDASTTLEYPRAASCVEKLGRHISVFITPNGRAAVLLAEDGKRLIRLRSLEAQYYRALIQESWGAHHLEGNLGTVWTGASCRDISIIIPYSRIVGHAATLSEQIPRVVSDPGARIQVWQRDPEQGSIEVHDVPVEREIHLRLDPFDLFIDAGLVEYLRKLRAAKCPSETGGVLLGYYDFNISAVMVVGALPAPPDSNSSPGSFERGIDGLVEAVREASRRTAGIVDYIGEWHSHPPGHSASPSSHDIIQLVHLAHGMADDGLPAVQLIVGDKDVQVLQLSLKR